MIDYVVEAVTSLWGALAGMLVSGLLTGLWAWISDGYFSGMLFIVLSVLFGIAGLLIQYRLEREKDRSQGARKGPSH